MLQDFSAGYYLLDAYIYAAEYDTPSMYVDEVHEMRSIAGVETIVGKIGSSYFEIRPSGAVPDRALVLPERVYRATDACEGPSEVLIAKEAALDVLDRSGVLS